MPLSFENLLQNCINYFFIEENCLKYLREIFFLAQPQLLIIALPSLPSRLIFRWVLRPVLQTFELRISGIPQDSERSIHRSNSGNGEWT